MTQGLSLAEVQRMVANGVPSDMTSLVISSVESIGSVKARRDVFPCVTKITMPVETSLIDAVHRLKSDGVFGSLKEIELIYPHEINAYMVFVRLNVDTANRFRVDTLTTWAGDRARSQTPHKYNQAGFAIEVHLNDQGSAGLIVMKRLNATYDLPQATNRELESTNATHLMKKHFGFT